MARTIELPQNLAELMADPQRIRDAIALLNALSQLEVRLVPPGGVRPLASGYKQILGDPPSLVLPLPLQLPSAIADSSTTAASVSAQLNLLLSGLRLTKILPTT